MLNDSDIEMFIEELSALRKEANDLPPSENISYLQKIERWGRFCTFLGYSSSWIAPNPLSMFLISQGVFTRWTTIAHTVLHKGYERFPGVPKRYTSKVFARGWRRWLDWPDWLYPEIWELEHNSLHHYSLGELGDPDLVEEFTKNLEFGKASIFIKNLSFLISPMSWKVGYYPPSSIKQYHRHLKKCKPRAKIINFSEDLKLFNPSTPEGRDLILKSWLSYSCYRFMILPALFFPLGPIAVLNVLINSIGAEILTNVHGFIMIVPNHAGEDLFRFESPSRNQEEFLIRQIIGSTNYRCGGDFNDFLHGWLNYQIEHHVWPDLSLKQYQFIQPKFEKLCKKYGIPYRKEHVHKRLLKLYRIYTGLGKMKKINSIDDILESSTQLNA